MALRLGTGGLKYPIPVAPDAQQSIAAASAGGSASASAYGANRAFAANKMRVQADLANSAADRDFRARSQMAEQGFRAQQNFYDREHQAGAQLQSQDFRANQEELDRNFRAFQQQSGQNFQSNQAQLDRDFTRERDKARFDREDAAIAEQDAQIQTDIEAGVAELTPQAQKQLDDIAASRAKMAGEQQWTPEQREEADKKWKEQERRIRRTAGRPQGPRGAAAFNQGTTFVDPKTGIAYDEPGEGRVPHNVQDRKPLIEQPDTSKEDQRKQSWLDKRADDLMKEEDDQGRRRYTPEEASRKATQDWDAREKGFQPPPPPAGMGDSVRQRSGSDIVPPPAPVQTAPPPVPLPGKPVGPTPTPQTLPQTPDSGAGVAPVPLGAGPGGQWVGPPPAAGAGPYGTWQGPPAPPQPGQQPPPVPLPGKPVGPTPTPQTLPQTPDSGAGVAPVPLGAGPGGQWVGPPPAAGAGPGGTWQGAHPQATTEAQFTDGWSKLPPGGTMVGPDGKVYVKKKA